MKLAPIVLTVLLSAATAFGVIHYAGSKTVQETKKETAFERVVRTNTLRCGYIVWAPYLNQDPSTKEKSGIVYDYITAIAQELDWKVEWTEEVGWGNFQEGLKTNHYDAMCFPLYETGLRGKLILMTKALYDDGLYAFGQADVTRFDKSLKSINQPDVTLSLVDGEAVSIAIKKNIFPKTKVAYMPQMVDQGQQMMEISTRKADVGFTSLYAVNKYNASAGNKVKIIGNGEPVSLYGNSLGVAIGEYDLKFAFDSAINAILKNGKAKRIIDKHSKYGFKMPSDY